MHRQRILLHSTLRLLLMAWCWSQRPKGALLCRVVRCEARLGSTVHRTVWAHQVWLLHHALLPHVWLQQVLWQHILRHRTLLHEPTLWSKSRLH